MAAGFSRPKIVAAGFSRTGVPDTSFALCPRVFPVEIVRTQFLRAANDGAFAFLAYCFMPDHVHLLVEGQSDDSHCRQFISRAKQFSGFHYRKVFGGRLWQRYGYERTLRSDEATLSVARYILENPVRAGLVECVEEYAFAGSDVYPIEQILEAVQMKASWYRAG